ncbi:hypothetical protein [Chryseobacterium shandongense]|uniref:DUF4268 domain-containing protein n=1 Tax=Chryseobacterium shandongense TaxID=1493872 RepID=A0ABM7BB80_9FLAO|nr:hypothetical protein [Chryseobacterium shandongense]AZA95637.1 hypothetical protein EG353_08685 [Chryseobacterium shandongense]
MTIIVHTKNAKSLLDAINNKIEKEELKTWEIRKNSKDQILYNHTPEQWSNTALFKPLNHEKGLELRINWWTGKEPDEATKGYILGRFTEILMVHFRKYFDFLETR